MGKVKLSRHASPVSATRREAVAVRENRTPQLRELYCRGDHAAAVRLVRRAQGVGLPLPARLRTVMEQHFGRGLGPVRLHMDRFAEEAARSLGANAFAVENDIFFARGAYAPEHPHGLRRLAHELAHTLQQGGRPGAEPQAALVRRLEEEANAAARIGSFPVPKLTCVGPMILCEPTYPRRCTGDALLAEVQRVLSLSRDAGAADDTLRMWSNVGSNFKGPTAGVMARKVWTYIFLRHFTEADSKPGVESSHARYFYSHTYGWIDGQHFFGFIDFAEQHYNDTGGDRQKAFDKATAQGLQIETDQQKIRDFIVLKRSPATDKTRLLQVDPPNTPLFRGPQSVVAFAAQAAASAYAMLSLGGTTQAELFNQLNAQQEKKFWEDCAKSAFTYEDFRSNQLGTRFFYKHGIAINAQPSQKEFAFRKALQNFFFDINVENDQAEVDRLASGLPNQEQFSAGKTTEAAERQAHPELFALPK